MNAIRSYIDNVFANLPRTDAVLRAKSDMLANMEEKYSELKAAGFSENEAIGKVIAEFGNMDELIAELRIDPSSSSSVAKDKKSRQISKEEAEDWISAKKRSGFTVAIGVFLCIAGVAAMIFLSAALHDLAWFKVNTVEDINPAIGITTMLVFVAVAVGLFIYSGLRLEKYTFIKEDFELKGGLQKWLEDRKDEFMPTYTITLILGVIMCILAPLVIILPIVIYGAADLAVTLVVIMLLLIATAVFLFTYFGSIKEAYDRLLKIGEYRDEPEDKAVNAISSGIWPLATIAFFIMGFVFDLWTIAWIVFPITGMLFAVIRAIVKAVKN